MIEQMLENLVSNAIKYTPSGGRVSLTLGSGEPNHLRIEIRDTGIGIPVEEQSQLYGEFFRASNAKTVSEHGTGLGLAIVKQTAELHGGRIRVESKESEGTTFTVDLPAS